MTEPIDELLLTLDAMLADTQAGGRPLAGFVRDDDAGWADDSLQALLVVVVSADVPIDLAAIPAAIGDRAADVLERWLAAAPGRVALHQHGYRHVDHQLSGRRCEFGEPRSVSEQARDLEAGWQLLQQRFGARVQPIFTPPWNRCAAATPAILARLGFRALSRDTSAPLQDDLPEIRVVVDWSRHYREGGLAAATRACATGIRAARSRGRPFGLMLHHAAMSPCERSGLGRVLRRLRGHPALHWRPMAALLVHDGF